MCTSHIHDVTTSTAVTAAAAATATLQLALGWGPASDQNGTAVLPAICDATATVLFAASVTFTFTDIIVMSVDPDTLTAC